MEDAAAERRKRRQKREERLAQREAQPKEDVSTNEEDKSVGTWRKNRFLDRRKDESNQGEEEKTTADKGIKKKEPEKSEDDDDDDDEEEDLVPPTRKTKAQVLFPHASQNKLTCVPGGFLHGDYILTPDESGRFPPSLWEKITARLRGGNPEDEQRRTLLHRDGIYEDAKAFDYLPARNVFRMKQRLHREFELDAALRPIQIVEDEPRTFKREALGSFEPNGRIQSLAYPIATQPVRPAAALGLTQIPTRLEISSVRTPKGIGKIGEAGTVKGAGAIKYSNLRVVINKIALYDHPLFTVEDRLSARIRLLYQEYAARTTSNLVFYHSCRLQQFLATYETASPVIDDIQQFQRDCFQEFGDLVDATSEYERLFSEIYQLWKSLQDERERQRFTSTPVTVVARERRLSEGKEDDIWPCDRLFELLEQVISEVDEQSLDSEHRYKRELQMQKYKKLAEQYRKLMDSKTRDFVKYVLCVANDASVNQTPENKSEAHRRKSIQETKLYAAVNVNGKFVASTNAVALHWPSFTCPIQQTIDLCVAYRPESVSINIFPAPDTFSLYQRLLSGSAAPLSSMSIPLVLPGQMLDDDIPFCSVGPTEQWYQFASEEEISPQESHSSFKGRRLSRHVVGAVNVQVEWQESQSPYEGLPAANVHRHQGERSSPFTGEKFARKRKVSKLPSSTSKSAGASTDFSRERDFLSLLAEMPNVDSNDPRNRDVVRLRTLFNSMSNTMQRSDVFRAAEIYEGLLVSHASIAQAITKTLVSAQNQLEAEAYQLSRRHRLLRLRQERPDQFTTPIPLDEDQIKRDDVYMVLLRPEVQQFEEDEDEQEEAAKQGLSLQKAQMKRKVYNFVKAIRENEVVRMRKQPRQRQIPRSSVVNEVCLFGEDRLEGVDCFSMLSRCFAPRRKLRPQAKLRTPMTSGIDNCRLFVQIENAINVPVRESRATPGPASRGKSRRTKRFGDDSDEDEAGDDVPTKQDRVNSFVEVRFQEHKKRTTCSEGPNPVWMETLVLPFTPPMNDFSATNLRLVKDEVHINLFDQYLIDERHLGGHYEEENQNFVRTEHRYLGTLTIPFSTIYLNVKIRGSFKCEVPLHQFGYEPAEKSSSTVSSNSKDSDALTRANATSTYLKVMATLDPPLASPEEVEESPSSGESRALLAYSNRWLTKLRKRNKATKDRAYQVFGTDISGEAVFLTRYLRPQAPPKGIRTIPQMVRFVSLIPFLEDWHVFSNACEMDLWSTSQQFLDLKAGDWEEHAILLRNYFDYYDTKHQTKFRSYLVLAHAMPEGEGVYVLRQGPRTKESIIWNASSGEGYDVKDKNCPITDVSIVATGANVYANIQKTSAPADLNWEIETSLENWQPFFTATNPRESFGKFASVQVAKLYYSPTPEELRIEVENELQETLKVQIRRWRSHRFTTSFNSSLGTKLRAILAKLELWKQQEVEFSLKQHHECLQSILDGNQYHVYGCPLNMTFTDVDKVVQAIRNTNIHWNENPKVQFGVAAYVHAYANEILSVWVYFVAMTPK